MSRKILVTIYLSIVCLVSFGQSDVVIGTVKDTMGNPLIAVTALEKGTTNGNLTDGNGRYTLSVSDVKSSIIIFSYVGYITQEIKVNNRSVVNVIMKEDPEMLGATIVVGYGSSTKREFTGASTSVKGKSIEKLNIPRVDQALQGQVSGVSINTNSGSPGGYSSIRIRGLSTFGDNDPLIIVDGVIYDSEGLNALNPNDIESINVLKDATAGIYGVRAANGVILIETKKGRKNSKAQFEFTGYRGIQETAKKLDLLNASEYAVLKNEMFASGGDDLPFPNTNLGTGTDWQNSVFQTARIMNYNLTATGGSEKTTYSIGGSYFYQDGIIGGEKSNFTRLNGRVNLSTDITDKLRFNSVFLYTNEDRNTLEENRIGSVLYNTVNAFPTDPVRDENGNYSYLEEVSDIVNPLAQIENTFHSDRVNKFVGKEELVYKISSNLKFTNRLNYNIALVDSKIFSPLVWFGPGKAKNTAINADLEPSQVEIAPKTLIDRGASISEARSTYSDINFESFLNHKKTFNNVHILKSTLGVSLFSRNGSQLQGTAYNIPNNSIDFADISANLAPGGYLNNVSSFQFRERLLSTFFRGEYRYGSKYTLSGILRRDGSSKFGPNNRYGIFPTVSGAWVISEEDKYKVGWMEFCKFRVSYGISGNDQIENFAYRGLLNGEGVYVFNDIITSGVAVGRASNPDLKWETTRQLNIGTDFRLLKSFSLTMNYFVKKTKDLLFQPDVSAVLGTAGAGSFAPIINAGDAVNNGLEIELGYKKTFFQKLKLNVNTNATFLRNEVKKTPDGVAFLPGAAFGVGGNIATRFQEGFPIGYFIGYQTDGIFQTQAEIDNASVQQHGAKPGDLRYVDQNGDGIINFSDDSDKIELGSPIPSLTLGLNLSLAYEGFDLSTTVFGAFGQEIIRNYERQQPYANQLSYAINRWTGPGSTNENHRLTTDLTQNTVFSDYYVEDGSFVRFKNVQLGYTFNGKKLKKLKLSSARIYISANNLFTITNYLGYDPDIGSAGETLSAGIDYGFYPQARTTMMGISIKF